MEQNDKETAVGPDMGQPATREETKKRIWDLGSTINFQAHDLSYHSYLLVQAKRSAGNYLVLGRMSGSVREYRRARKRVDKSFLSLKNTVELLISDSETAFKDEKDDIWKSIWGLINSEAQIMLEALRSKNGAALHECLRYLNLRLVPCDSSKRE